MKKIVLFTIVTLFIGIYSAMAVEVKFDIPADKIDRVIAAMKGLYPVPRDEQGEPLFTDSQWAKEAVRRFIVSTVQRYETLVAREAIVIDADNNIAQ